MNKYKHNSKQNKTNSLLDFYHRNNEQAQQKQEKYWKYVRWNRYAELLVNKDGQGKKMKKLGKNAIYKKSAYREPKENNRMGYTRVTNEWRQAGEKSTWQ